MKREQRTSERAAAVVAVDLWRGREKRRAFARDVSEGGLCVVDGNVADGGYVTIGVVLEDGARFTALCRVAWRDAKRAGLAFVDASSSLRAAFAARAARAPARRAA